MHDEDEPQTQAAAPDDAVGAATDDGDGTEAPADHGEPDDAEETSESFEELLLHLKEARGFDFTGYKRTSLGRRVRKRMDDIGVEDHTTYLDHIQAHPEEVADLFDTILINVTAFRRDPEHWDHLREHVLPKIIEQARNEEHIRVWSAGCSTGEEAYTIAMEFCELLGIAEFKHRVKVYATDVDGHALEQARRGKYDARAVESLPEEWVERYFEKSGPKREFRRDIRRSIIFGRHDIVQDAPISRIDLLVCRNLLMYFQAETQTRILSRLHFGLKDDGFMFLGRAEMLLTRSHLFEPVDLPHRIFRKSGDTVGSVRQPPQPGTHLSLPTIRTKSIKLRDLSFDASPIAQVVLDRERHVTLVNTRARAMFTIGAGAIGQPFSDLDISYRPVELRGHLDSAEEQQRRITLSNVARVDGEGEVQHLDISVIPLRATDGSDAGMLITFEDVSEFERLRADLQRSNHDLETAYEELQSTNEELLTTNEELQSTVEELETTNEELQSTNEELETMNEELQSSNLEQEEVNNELNQRTRELDRANEFLRTILTSMDSGVIVVDEELRIHVWDETSADTWGLRQEEVLGQRLGSLDCGLPTSELVPVITDAIEDTRESETELPAVNRVGRKVVCSIRILPLRRGSGFAGALIIVGTAPAANGT